MKNNFIFHENIVGDKLFLGFCWFWLFLRAFELVRILFMMNFINLFFRVSVGDNVIPIHDLGVML